MLEISYIPVFVKVTLAFLIIMDPFVSASYFLEISKGFSKRQKSDAIKRATYIAAAAFITFLVSGPFLLSMLGVSLSSFMIAGGLILLIISVQFILKSPSNKPMNPKYQSDAIMIIGVPLITGPGVMTTAIIMAGTQGYIITLLSGLLAIALVYLILKSSILIHRVLGPTGIEISSKILGLLLTALAVEFIKNGLTQI